MTSRDQSQVSSQGLPFQVVFPAGGLEPSQQKAVFVQQQKPVLPALVAEKQVQQQEPQDQKTSSKWRGPLLARGVYPGERRSKWADIFFPRGEKSGQMGYRR